MKLVCWDYNGTLADYDKVRPNIAGVLVELRNKGYSNVVTTTLEKEPTKDELAKHGLDKLVDGVFGNRRSASRQGKVYQDVLSELRISKNHASEQVIIVGDSTHDCAEDLDNIVFVHNPNGYATDARIVQELFYQLSPANNTGFYEGFLACQRTSIDLVHENGFIYHGRLDIQQSHAGMIVSVKQDYSSLPKLIPTVLLITHTEAEKFSQLEAVRC